MKCVRLLGQGMPARVTDATAQKIVEVDRDGEYCRKQFFRDFWATVPDTNDMKKSVMTAWAKARESVATFTPPKRKKT